MNPQHRPSTSRAASDYVFEGYELDDALERRTRRSRTTRASRSRTAAAAVKPFAREELLKPLERWFFGRSSR